MAGIFVGKTPICSESTINPNQAEIQERYSERLQNLKCLLYF
jgi:hypothetical protein